jgi:hypothetical protein
VRFSNVFPSDVAALKARLSPWVSLVDAIVARTPSVPRDLRAGWASFVSEWRAYLADEGLLFSPPRFERGLALEEKLRDWRTALSSQCRGIPVPAPKRPTPFFGTWASPDDVRALKARVDPLLRDLNDRVASCPADPALRKAWSDFFRAWRAFFSQEDEWIHGATQLECAQAYEDSVAEWREAVEMGCAPAVGPDAPGAGAAPPAPSATPGPAQPGPPAAGPNAPIPPPPWMPPWAPPPAASPASPVSGRGGDIAITFGLLAVAFALARARHP